MRLIEEPYAVAPHVRFCEGRCNIRLLDFLLLCIKTKKLRTMNKMSQGSASKDSVLEISEFYNCEKRVSKQSPFENTSVYGGKHR